MPMMARTVTGPSTMTTWVVVSGVSWPTSDMHPAIVTVTACDAVDTVVQHHPPRVLGARVIHGRPIRADDAARVRIDLEQWRAAGEANLFGRHLEVVAEPAEA